MPLARLIHFLIAVQLARGGKTSKDIPSMEQIMYNLPDPEAQADQEETLVNERDAMFRHMWENSSGDSD